MFGGVKLGRNIRVPQEGIDEFMANQKQNVSNAATGRERIQRAKEPVGSMANEKIYKLAARHLSKKFLRSMGMTPQEIKGVV